MTRKCAPYNQNYGKVYDLKIKHKKNIVDFYTGTHPKHQNPDGLTVFTKIMFGSKTKNYN